MKKLLKTALIVMAGLSSLTSATAQTGGRAYGIRLYSEDATDDKQCLVSFSLDNPEDMTVELNFGEDRYLAAAGNGTTYYLLKTEDDVLPSALITYDLETKTWEEVKSYTINEMGGRLIPLDMTYDRENGYLYVTGADLADATIVDGELDANFGLFRIDPASGEAEFVGYQTYAILVSIAAGDEDIWGIDEDGNLWMVNKNSGKLLDIMESTFVRPTGLQSMAWDPTSDTYYWPSYSIDPETGENVTDLFSFYIDEDWDFYCNHLGKVGANAELIGLHIDPNPINRNAPGELTGLKVTPDAYGQLNATITGTFPNETLNGDPLTGRLSAKIFRNGENIGEIMGQPGTTLSYIDNVPASASYIYSVSVSKGTLTGPAVYASEVFVGEDIPGAPANLKAEKRSEGFDITVSWAAPTSGANGGWYDSSNLHYNVTRLPDNKVIAADTRELSLTDGDITTQAGYSYVVKVIAGDSFGPEATSNIVVSGPALTVPYTMTLSKEDEELWISYDSDNDGYTWYVNRGMWGGTTEPFFRYYPEEILDPKGEADDWLISPMFHLEAGKKYLAAYDLRLLGALFPANTSIWLGNNANPESMTTRLATYEQEINDIVWEEHWVSFTVAETGDYNLGCHVENLVPIQFSHFQLREVTDTDMGVTYLYGPRGGSAGMVLSYAVTVKNLGFEAPDNFVVQLRDINNGSILCQREVSDVLKTGESETVNLEWTPSEAGQYSIVGETVTNGDNTDENNVSEAIEVSIAGEGTWKDAAQGDKDFFRLPFDPVYHFSAGQTIYPAEEIGVTGSHKVMAINYNIPYYNQNSTSSFDVEIYMGNTDRGEFSRTNPKPIDLSGMTKVYSGPLFVNPGGGNLTIVLDEEFDYQGGNLVVCTRTTSTLPKTYHMSFRISEDLEGPFRSIEANSDETEIIFGTTEMTSYQALPTLGLLFDGDLGAGAATADLMHPSIVYDRTTRRVMIQGQYSTCRAYTMSGKLIGCWKSGSAIVLPEGEGVAIVEVTSAAGRTLRKIAL